MAILIMPAHEAGDQTGTVVKWHKRVGDWVEQGDELFTYSMESGVYMAVCEQEGRLTAIYLPQGESAPCPADVALIAAPSVEGALAFCKLDGLRKIAEAPEEQAPENEIEEENPAQETPAEETPKEETAALAAFAEESLVEEIQTEEAPVEEAPASPIEEAETAPASPTAQRGLYVEDFDAASFRRLLGAFDLTAPARKGASITKRVLLVFACLQVDAGLLGLEACSDLTLQDVAEFVAEGVLEADGVRVCELKWMAQERAGGACLCMGRLADRAYLSLTGCKQAQAEAFLPSLVSVLEALDRHIR